MTAPDRLTASRLRAASETLALLAATEKLDDHTQDAIGHVRHVLLDRSVKYTDEQTGDPMSLLPKSKPSAVPKSVADQRVTVTSPQTAAATGKGSKK